jgi:hypothetical protein
MSEVKATVEIDAPPAEVFDTAWTRSRTPDWVTIVLRVEGKDGGELREGYKMRQRLCLRGVPFTVEWELTRSTPRTSRAGRARAPAASKAITENHLEDRAAAPTSPTRTSSRRRSARWARWRPAR